MKDNKILATGLIGTVIAALCCFTPVLVISLGAVGLSALIGGIDYVAFPIMFASLGFVAFALYQRSGGIGFNPNPVIAVLVIAFSTALLFLEFRYALRISLAAVALVAIYGFYLRSAKSKTA